MLKESLVILFYLGIFVTLGECGVEPVVDSHNNTVAELDPAPVYTSNTLPALEEGCQFVFYCHKKYLEAQSPKPCLSLCVRHLLCNNKKRSIARGHCLTFDEATVAQEYSDFVAKGKLDVMKVAMIDFPCQPGYLPDNRGRCREVW